MSLGPGIAAIALLTAASLMAGCSREPSRGQVEAWNAEVKRLEAEQDSLRQRAAELVAGDARVQRLPKGDVVISVPTAFVRNVIQRVVDDVASRVTLRLRGLKARVAKSIKKVVTLGEFVVDVDIHEIVGTLRVRQPDVGFAGDRISMSLPVEVQKGHGAATIHFVWDGKNVAGAACGDMDVTQKVSGNVIPSSYVVSGRLDLGLRGHQVVCKPRFPETKLRIRIRPSKQSWNAIDSLLAEKHGVCGFVLDKVNVPQILKNLVEEKGFNVKLPIDKIRPFEIPAAIQDSVTVEGRTVFLATTTNTIRIDPDAILYSAGVALK